MRKTNVRTSVTAPEPVLVRKVSPKDFAKANSVSTMTVYRALKAGQIPGATKFRSQWRIPLDATFTA